MKIKNLGLFLALISLINCGWLPEVSGYSEYDDMNGYAGIMGQAVTAIKVSGGKAYRVHAGGKWLSAVKSGSCGNGQEIDAIAVKGATYKVHVMGGDWLPEVSGYDISDDMNGYAGIIGQTIDAVAIQGRTYAVCYGSGCGSGGGEEEGGDDDQPVTPTGDYGSMSTRASGCTMSRSTYINKVKNYCNSVGNLASALCNNAGLVYDTMKTAGANPYLVMARAVVEGNDPGDGYNNYWGINCWNGGGYEACSSYGSLTEGVQAFASICTSYNDLASMMQKYAYIGDYWFNPGSWADGGCIYFPYIRKYMSASRASQVDYICSKGTTCYPSGGDCTATIPEDQHAYSSWNVGEKMGPTLNQMFGI